MTSQPDKHRSKNKWRKLPACGATTDRKLEAYATAQSDSYFSNGANSDFPPPNAAADEGTTWLVRHEAYLKMLARLEIDSRFQGKFSASDAVQQTMLEAWRGWQNFRGSTEAERLAWVRGILAHQLAHLARHFAGARKRDVSRELSLDASLAQSSQRLDQLLAGGGPSPSAVAVAAEQRLRLAEVLERLPEDYRQVILLHNPQDLPYEEIARRMDRGVGAVRMLWVRALARLRDEIQGDSDWRT